MNIVNFIQSFAKTPFLVDCRLSEVGDNCEFQMDPPPRGGNPVSYQSSLPDPNTFQQKKETTTDAMVESISFWQDLLSDVHSPKVPVYQYFSICIMYDLQLHNHRSCILLWTICPLIPSDFQSL